MKLVSNMTSLFFFLYQLQSLAFTSCVKVHMKYLNTFYFEKYRTNKGFLLDTFIRFCTIITFYVIHNLFRNIVDDS